MNHTPGPWRVSTDHYHIEAGSVSVAAVFGSMGHGQIQAESLANARLIAAAPDLYEVLKAILTHVEDPDIPRVNNQCTLCHTWREKACAALAKAEEK